MFKNTKVQNVGRDLDLSPCNQCQGQRSQRPKEKTPGHYLLWFLNFRYICDKSNVEGEITPIKSCRIPSTQM